MELRRLFIEPHELARLRVDDELTEDGRVFVFFGKHDEAYTIVTASDARRIRDAWADIANRLTG